MTTNADTTTPTASRPHRPGARPAPGPVAGVSIANWHGTVSIEPD